MLMLLFRVVPLLSIDEIEEIEEIEEATNAAAAAAYLSTEHPTPTEPSGQDPQLVGATGKAPQVAGAARTATVVLLVAMLGTFSVGAAPSADAATTPGSPKITLTGIESGGAVQLTAKLTDPAGAPLANADVTFLIATTVFGPRAVPLGTVGTDPTGIARLPLGADADHRYRPTSTGPQEFVASYTAESQEPVEFSTNVNVTAAHTAYTPAPPKPLVAAGHALAKALFIIVATIWILLIAQVVRVRRVCRPQPKGTVSSA